jgi:hypothetical protein
MSESGGSNSSKIGANFGGFVKQLVDPEEHKRLPRAVRVNQLAANVVQYKETVIRNGIPHR